MTENEAIEILKYYDKQPYFFSRDASADYAFKMAIQALEEIQQYRAIGLTPKMVKEMIESEKLASHQAIIRGAKLEQYEAIGTIDEFKALKEKSEQELLLELPCRVGDKVYKYHEEKGAVLEYTVWSIHISAYESGGVDIVIEGVAEDEEEWEDDFSLSLQEFKTQFSSTKGQALAEINI